APVYVLTTTQGFTKSKIIRLSQTQTPTGTLLIHADPVRRVLKDALLRVRPSSTQELRLVTYGDNEYVLFPLSTAYHHSDLPVVGSRGTTTFVPGIAHSVSIDIKANFPLARGSTRGSWEIGSGTTVTTSILSATEPQVVEIPPWNTVLVGRKELDSVA